MPGRLPSCHQCSFKLGREVLGISGRSLRSGAWAEVGDGEAGGRQAAPQGSEHAAAVQPRSSPLGTRGPLCLHLKKAPWSGRRPLSLRSCRLAF